MVCAQLIFGKNKEPFLEYALRSVAWVDYFTVCNTAPHSQWGQKNKEILFNTVPPKWIRYEELEGEFSFSKARNICIQLTDEGDHIFIVDADDVHYPQWENEVKHHIKEGVDSITAHFYHIVAYKNLFQFTQPREIVYKKYTDTQFVKDVHEQLITKRVWPITSPYHYMHYGYLKPQREVFKRWKFYSDLENDFHHYDGQNPDTIIEDRISVCKELPVDHPPVMQNYLAQLPVCSPERLSANFERVAPERVGLALIALPGDIDDLRQCLDSLSETIRYPEFEVMALSADDECTRVLLEEQRFPVDVIGIDASLSLTETLNYAFNSFRQRVDIQYIGWIHPDMQFKDSFWLKELWQVLHDYEKVGKVCSANTRDPLPEKMIEAQEQCYIIRKEIINKIGLFDENFIGIGGYEDWDMNKRIMNHNNYKVMVAPTSQVYHKGMATRSRRNTTAEAQHNSAYYHEKHGTYEPSV